MATTGQPPSTPPADQRSPGIKRPGSATPQPFTHWLVLDFEATCQEVNPLEWPFEVIELPIVVVEVATGRAVAEFREYVRPLVNPRLSAFCTQLTGIQQAHVDAAGPFPAVFERACEFLEHTLYRSGGPQPATGPSASTIGGSPASPSSGSSARPHAIFVTCGNWDLLTLLPAQARLFRNFRVPPLWQRWCNIQNPYQAWAQEALPGGAPQKPGMPQMLEGLGLPLVGRHHCGLDDARNIAAIARALAARGIVLNQTNSWNSYLRYQLGA